MSTDPVLVIAENLKSQKNIVRIWIDNDPDGADGDKICIAMYYDGSGNIFGKYGPLFSERFSGSSFRSWVRGSELIYSPNINYSDLTGESLITLFMFDGEKERFYNWCQKSIY
jgi:hypothetical protein